MTGSTPRLHTDHMVTATCALLAAALLIPMITQPTIAATSLLVIGILCSLTIHRWLRRTGRSPTSFLRRLKPLRPVYGLAALLLLAAPLIRYWTAGQLSLPAANVPISNLIARTGGNTAEILVPAGTDHFLIVLNLNASRSYADYTITVLGDDPGEVERFSRTGLEPSPAGNFNLMVPRSFMPAGRYRIVLFGRDGQTLESVAEYKVQVDYG